MSKAGKMIKNMVKAKKESVMGKLGDSPYEDPMEPWSAKHSAPVRNEGVEEVNELHIDTIKSYADKAKASKPDNINKAIKRFAGKERAVDRIHSDELKKMSQRLNKEEFEELLEDTWLFKYIRSLGYNPKIMTFAQRSKWARSNAFKHFKQAHAQDTSGATQTQQESVESLDEAGTGLLMSYIKSKGLDPNTMDTNKRHSYSRSSEFRIFKMRHMNRKIKETSGMGERGEDWNEEKKPVKESADKADTVTLDIPLMIRVLEYAREDAKTDMDLHRVVENLINMRSKGVLSMDDYEAIVNVKKIKEDSEQIDELKKMPDNMDGEDHITREEKGPCWSKYKMVGMKKKAGKTVPNCVPESVQEGIGGIEDSPMSATNSVKAMESHRQKQLKSARMIKSIYKKKLKETMYDWEKDDKGGKAPTAKVVLKGGKTLTGKDRDTIEIEPILVTRPNSMGGNKSSN